MQIHKISRTKQVFALITGFTMLTGLLGLMFMFATGFKNTEIYWSSLWTFVGCMGTGIILARIYSMIWSKK